MISRIQAVWSWVEISRVNQAIAFGHIIQKIYGQNIPGNTLSGFIHHGFSFRYLEYLYSSQAPFLLSRFLLKYKWLYNSADVAFAGIDTKFTRTIIFIIIIILVLYFLWAQALFLRPMGKKKLLIQLQTMLRTFFRYRSYSINQFLVHQF